MVIQFLFTKRKPTGICFFSVISAVNNASGFHDRQKKTFQLNEIFESLRDELQ
jgi:hypothetical protein